MKGIYVAVVRKGERIQVQWIIKVLLLFCFKWKADCSERNYALSVFAIHGLHKELGCACFRYSSTNEIYHSKRKDYNKDRSVRDWYGLKPLSTTLGVVHVVRSTIV